MIKRALNHKSGDVTDGYIISRVRELRPVFDTVSKGYHDYYDPDWRNDEKIEKALKEDQSIYDQWPDGVMSL